ncbi:MAG: methyltransferase domain-containing protein [Candidatus Heimdallarchaeota archaeon]|nr:methyltransferase domain-containing protein [Candidatus Heimdallarchaeota archaeon]
MIFIFCTQRDFFLYLKNYTKMIVMVIKEPNRITIFFTKLRQTLFRPYYKRYVKSLKIKANEKVIDFGSNTGYMTRYIVEKLVGREAHLTCVDISETWIAISKQHLKDFENVDYQVGDITKLNISDNFYDRVIVHFVLHEISPSKRKDILQTLVAKLKTGGRLYLREPTVSWHGIAKTEIQKLVQQVNLNVIQTTHGLSRLVVPTFTGIFKKEGKNE